MSGAIRAPDIHRRPLEMQTTRRLFSFLLCLAFISLACLSTGEPYVTYPADTPTLINSTVAPSATNLPSPEPSPSWKESECVVISADEALHLRIGARETSQSLAFMESGEVVKLISTAN